jgi:PBP1b-binding outer membrane lipoprotein LpoB
MLMTKSRLFSSLVLLAVLLASCAPAAVTESPVQPVDPVAVESSATTIPNVDQASTPAVDLTATYMLELLSATPPSDTFPVATSRGPNLEATDPTTVSMASGSLQLVEFFEFW